MGIYKNIVLFCWLFDLVKSGISYVEIHDKNCLKNEEIVPPVRGWSSLPSLGLHSPIGLQGGRGRYGGGSLLRLRWSRRPGRWETSWGSRVDGGGSACFDVLRQKAM